VAPNRFFSKKKLGDFPAGYSFGAAEKNSEAGN